MPVRTPRVVTYVIWVLLLALAIGQPAANAKAPAMAPSEVLGVHAETDSKALQGKVYVALGDSISAGRYATAQDGIFPALVADKLGMTLDLVARSGAKAAWALPQLGRILAAHPALVTIELGTNDAGFHTPGDAFSAQYDAIVGAVSGPSTRVLCIGSWLPSPSFDGLIAEACVRHGGTFVSLDGFYAVNAFHAGDGGSSYLGRTDFFHPGDQGHAAIAAAVLSALGAGPAPVIGPLPPAPQIPDVIRTHPQ
ncbi:MAG TPA: SGNH/GDSL hydrolase family protein [Candidatus Dormibacteraeota bacterium]|nr:SGNH/GDSL hydrolase family protein [Candidatus Dormibacteraeota bacterium]